MAEVQVAPPPPQLRTDAEITELKRQWLADPCWDIEDTGGFEAHRHELTAFRLRHEKEWLGEQVAAAQRLGVSVHGHAMLINLERRVAALEAARG